MKADIRSYLWQGDCPLLPFTYPGFDCDLFHPARIPKGKPPPSPRPPGLAITALQHRRECADPCPPKRSSTAAGSLCSRRFLRALTKSKVVRLHVLIQHAWVAIATQQTPYNRYTSIDALGNSEPRPKTAIQAQKHVNGSLANGTED